MTRKYPPDFTQLEKVLKRQKADRPVLFEYFMNGELFSYVLERSYSKLTNNPDRIRMIIEFFYKTGYDYATIPARYLDTLSFESKDFNKKESISLNESSIIKDRESFSSYKWPNPEIGNYHLLNEASTFLPKGMKFIVSGPGGLLENVIYLVGFENLCFMVLEDEDLTRDIFDEVGSRLLRFYEICCSFESVGALIVNDDWGFKNQTMFSPDTLRQFVFPWHKKIVKAIHENGKYAILHSCGNISDVMDDVVYDMEYDAKHSYEDIILPVEKAHDMWHNKIAILGGIDIDFLVRSSPEEIKQRAKKLLELTGLKSYALGSGNSIPVYIPFENYLAMIEAVND